MRRTGPLLGLALLLSGAVGQLQAQQPLTMEGKTRLYERVLMRATAPRLSEPGGPAMPGPSATAVEPYYVYAHRQAEGAGWLQLGAGTQAERLFWVPEADTIPWRQNIVLTFTNHGDPERVLILEDLDALYEVIESEDPGRVAAALRDSAQVREQALRRAEAAPAANGVVALGPARGIDEREHFYVMPILSAEEALMETGGFVNLLEVAVAKTTAPAGLQPQAATPTPPPAPHDFKAGVVFVIDTTISMRPYIDATRDVVARMYDRLRHSPIGDRVAFGLIGFRDALGSSPSADDYLVRRFIDLPEGSDGRAFLDAIAQMTEADKSNKGFDEDSSAGVSEALEHIAWGGFDARFIVLITDAGPRPPNDPLASVALGPKGLANYAWESKKAAIAILHLRTPQGKNDHDRAEVAYRELSSQTNIGDLYYGVPDGDLGNFSGTAEQLAAEIVTTVEDMAGDVKSIAPAAAPAPLDQDQYALLDRVRQVARAMQLDYLGARAGEDAPDLFAGWLADRDFSRPEIKPVEVRLLLTKNQLSDLEEALSIIIRQGEEHLLEPELFFRQVLAAAADMARQPEGVARRVDTLADAAVIREYLEGLPYASHVMNLTEDDWLRLSIAEQQELMDLLTDKVARYQALHDTPEVWFRLQASDPSGEEVYPMLLDDLP